MGFRITFTDNNVAEEGHNIYRSTTSMAGLTLAEMPAPVATLGPDVTAWDDGNVTEGETYYYRVGAFTASGTVELLSDEFTAEAVELAIADAVFTFETESRVEAPTNWVEYSTGLGNSLSVTGQPLPWGVSHVSGSPASTDTDIDPGYNLGWPADPVVSGADYTIRSTGTAMIFDITGLTPGRPYDLSFVGSRSSGSPRTLQITIDGIAKGMNVEQNATETLDFASVIADVNGTIRFEFTLVENGGYLSAFYVRGEA